MRGNRPAYSFLPGVWFMALAGMAVSTATPALSRDEPDSEKQQVTKPASTPVSAGSAHQSGPVIAPIHNPAMANRERIRQFFDPHNQWNAPVLRFETMDGRPAFVLDRSGPAPLFRYAQGGEVLVLREVHTTRGDMLYKNDQGDVVLRRHRVGDATLFPQGRSRGIAAWAVGSARPILPDPVEPDELRSDLGAIVRNMAHLLQQDLTISVNGATDETAWIYDETGRNLLQAVRRMLRMAKPSAPLDQIRQIRIEPGDLAGITLRGDTLTLQVNAQAGFSGRLSSLAMERFLWGDHPRRENDTLPLTKVESHTASGASSGAAGGIPEREQLVVP